MPAGRPPKPIERKLALAKGDGRDTGNRKIAVPEFKLTPAVTIPVCPEELGDRGQTEWDKIWSAGYWLSPEQDYHWVAMIATAYDEIEQYRAEIAFTGYTVEGIRGTTVANPLIAEIRRAQGMITKCLSQLGFSPTDRARLGLAEVKRKSEIAKLQQMMKDK